MKEEKKISGLSEEARFELVPRMHTTYRTLCCHQGSVAQLVRVSD